jgi:tellurite resistance protein TerC
VILVFIGIKLVLHWAHGIWSGVPEIPTTTSLFVIIGILVVTTIASIIAVRKDPSRVAHAGSIREHEQGDDH